MKIRKPTLEELPEVVKIVSDAFGYKADEGSVADDFAQLYSASNIDHLRVISDQEKILGHAGFYPTFLKVESLPLPVAGIGGVCTIPEAAGQGIATTLVDACLESAHKQGAALAFLWSDKIDFYAKQGFHLTGRQWTISLEPSHIPLLKERSSTVSHGLRFEDQNVTPSFIYQSYQLLSAYEIGTTRTMDEHSLLLSSGASQIVGAWVGQQLAAYFVIGKGKDLVGYVHEWAGDEQALHALAAHCLERRGALQVLSPQFMPEEVSWIYTLDQMGVAMRADRMGLVKILDFEKVKKLIKTYLEKHQSDHLTLVRNGTGFQVQWKNEMPWVLDEKGLLGFLFGPEMPNHPELKAFLPMRLWYWGLDSV